MTILLAFDTATDACSVALSIDGRFISRHALAPRQHAERLLAMIADVLDEAGLKLNDMDAIAFGQGPGSFIGVRIAAAVAQSLGFAASLPVVAISTLQALAQEAYLSQQLSSVVVAWDARMGEVYWGSYQLDDRQLMQPVLEDQLSAPDQVKVTGDSDFAAVGNAWHVYRQALMQTLQYATGVNEVLYPTATALACLGVDAYQQGQYLEPCDAEPLYLRNQVARKPKKESI